MIRAVLSFELINSFMVSYAIGVAEPTSISVNTFGTGVVSDDKIAELVRKHFDLRPGGIIEMLDCLEGIGFPVLYF